ncbi:MAG: xanthine dehydrogenase family protein molybdopterin-binding subunit, partial [Burkholderiaceae bacterium]
MEQDAMQSIGPAQARIEGRDKVTGAARFAADEPLANLAYAYLVTSTIAHGRIRKIDTREALAMRGVLDILTHENVGDQIKPIPGLDGSPTSPTLDSAEVAHDGQLIAVVVAESYETARAAANRLAVSYEEKELSAVLDAPGVEIEPAKPMSGPPPVKGNAAKAFQSAPVQFEAQYGTPTQHHNAIELFTTTAVWEDGKLTIYEPTQFMWGTKAALAKELQMDPDDIRVVSRFVGGAFGSKGPNTRSAWIALAARRLGRPVRMVATRAQGFTTATYRAETRQNVKLGADADGRLLALVHDGLELTSRASGYNAAGVDTTARMYACENIATSVSVVHADRNTPGFMRAPPETPYMFALESAMDELAHQLGMDPIELRRKNDTQTDPLSGVPFSTRAVMSCFDEGAKRFGWKNRPQPGSKREGDWMIGYGCAMACYPSNIGPAAIRLTLTSEGKAIAALAAHEIGNGAYTTVALTVARLLGIGIEDVSVVLGDSDLPPVMIAGGSNNAASTAHAATMACEAMRKKLAEAALLEPDS